MTILIVLKRVDCNDGVAAYIESLIIGLHDLGIGAIIVSGEVTTLYGSESRQASISAAAVDWLVLKDLGKAWPKLCHLRNMIDVIRRHNVTVISPQGFQVLPLSSICGRLSNRPVVTNFHLLQENFSWAQRLGYRAIPALFGSDAYLAMSQEIAEFFVSSCNIPLHRIHQESLGVDTDFFRSPTEAERRRARERFGLDQSTFIAVLPGRMNLSKGHDLAATAFRIIRTRRPTLAPICLFPGGGDQREQIEAETLRDDADHKTFRFLGFVDRETIRDAYWSADIVMLPSRVEGFPLVVCEAMCSGAIVIRTPGSGWRQQVIEGKTGYIVPFNDPQALAIAIEKVIDSPDRSAMREHAMVVASSEFSRNRMIAGTAALYRTVIEQKPRRRQKWPLSVFTSAERPNEVGPRRRVRDK